MKKSIFVLFVCFISLFPIISNAAPSRPGAYVTAYLGFNVPSDTNVTTFQSNGAVYDEKIGFSPGFTTGVAGGYNFGPVRLEGEYSYKAANIESISDNAGKEQYYNVRGSMDAMAFMANAFFNIENESRVTPYLGGGVGFATLYMNNTFATSRSNGYRTVMYPSGDATVFAYQLGAGLDIAINRRYSIDVGYRYFGTSTATFSGSHYWDNYYNSDLGQANGVKFESHNGTVGFKVKF